MVHKDFPRRGGLEERRQPLRAGKVVAVQLDHQVTAPDGSLRSGRVRVEIQVFDLRRQDEQQIVRRGVRQHAGDSLALSGEPERHGGAGTQRVAVRVRVPHDDNPCRFLYGRPEGLDVFLTQLYHAQEQFAMANLQKIIAFEKSFC